MAYFTLFGIIAGIMFVSSSYLKPVLLDSPGDIWGRLIYTAVTITVMSPFLLALCYPSTKKMGKGEAAE